MVQILKYNLEIMTGLCVLSTLFLFMFWNNINTYLKLVLIYAIFITLHEWEETRYPGGFTKIMTRKLKVDATGIEPWKMHIYQAIYIIIIIALPFIFQDVIWLSLVPFYLGIFECFVHILGIKIMDMKKPYSPGMITAIIMAIPSFYGIWYLKTQNLVFGYEWIYALVLFLVGFIIMQQLILRTVLDIHDMHEAFNNVFKE